MCMHVHEISSSFQKSLRGWKNGRGRSYRMLTHDISHIISLCVFIVPLHPSIPQLLQSLRHDRNSLCSLLPKDVIQYIILPMVADVRGRVADLNTYV